MDTDIGVALIALVGTAGSLLWQWKTGRDQRRLTAKTVLDRYRGPLLGAAFELGDRIDNIRHRDFLDVRRVEARETQAKLSTMFRFAQFFGWREILRTEVQLLKFDHERDTQPTRVGAVRASHAAGRGPRLPATALDPDSAYRVARLAVG